MLITLSASREKNNMLKIKKNDNTLSMSEKFVFAPDLFYTIRCDVYFVFT